MENITDVAPCESMNESPLLQNPAPLYAECLSCPDFVTTCRGIDITSLSGAAEKRDYHKAIKKDFGFLLKDIYPLVKHVIGKTTADEYFGSGAGDYKWTTVVTIHNALLSLVAQKKGMPLCENSCSASSSKVRNQLAAADLNLAAANMNLATMRAECDDLRRRLSDSDGAHLAQIADLRNGNRDEVDWLKNGVRLWRKVAITLLVSVLVLLGFLLIYVGWDIFSPNHGLIRF